MFRLLENSADPFRPHDPGPPPAEVRRFLTREFRPLRAVVVLALATTVAGAAIEVWLIGYAGRLVDVLAGADRDRFWSRHGAGLIFAAVLVLLVRPLLSVLGEGLDDIAFRANARSLARWRLHRYVSRQSVGWFRDDLAGRIATWVRDGGEAASTAGYAVIHTLVAVAVYIAGSVWLVASIDPRLVLPLAAWIVVYAVLLTFLVPRYRAAHERLQEAESALTGLLVDSYANADTLALFPDREADDLRVFAAARRAHFGVQRLEVTINSSMTTLGGGLLVGLIGYGIVLWRTGAAPVGLVAAASALSFRITSMGEWLLDALSDMFGALGQLNRSLRTVAQPLAVRDAQQAVVLPRVSGRIRFEGVSHHYGRPSGGLDGFDLDVAAGERVGLVGRSGAGKSTVVSLLLRFYEAESGTISIDGRRIADVTQDSLRRQFAVVAQEATLLHRSVRDNVAGGIASDDEAVRAAARRAAADGFITALRDSQGRQGYDALVGERGIRLSGGQRQRVALARALHRDAPILILDEATSALDSEVEAAIQETLGEVMEGRTVIAIAHRLSTIARMDRIVVLDAGRIAEQGTHESLLAASGLYAMLWSRQSGGFL
ncbi:ABC transporter ATP-binding protein [Catenulispora sp. EB89]|uniref:ABC transporter ATP-binding protein n=1 Tax=Catenulispora sp. EB89 TaxID=3156257 RepID=UPI003510E3F5